LRSGLRGGVLSPAVKELIIATNATERIRRLGQVIVTTRNREASPVKPSSLVEGGLGGGEEQLLFEGASESVFQVSFNPCVADARRLEVFGRLGVHHEVTSVDLNESEIRPLRDDQKEQNDET
jgi:hypothetical protein